MAAASKPSSYDDVPYPPLCYTQSHPDLQAALATLVGMEPPHVETSSVLEVGCAAGGNIIPMAYAMPRARFVGVDNSERQIDAGRDMVRELGLDNIELRCQDILDLHGEMGRFGFIIAHGVYSWVPAATRDKLLEVCRASLAPSGVAYVSYNTYPGWHQMSVIRDLMLYRTRDLADPSERADEARRIVDLLARYMESARGSLSGFVAQYESELVDRLESGSEWRDAVLLHDEMEQVNEPVYFHEFAEHASRHGLQYVAETDLPGVMTGNLPDGIEESLLAMAGDIIELEQYVDFLRNRMFRKTLLCRDDVSLDRAMRPQRAMGLSFSAGAWPEADNPDVGGVGVERFKSPDGAVFSTDHPVTKAAMLHLARVAPQVVPFRELFETSWREVHGDIYELHEDAPHYDARRHDARRHDARDRDVRGRDARDQETRDQETLDRDALDREAINHEAAVLAANLLRALTYSFRLVEPHAFRPRFASEVSGRPRASGCARYQARHGRQVANLRHERVAMPDAFTGRLLALLDGERDRASLRAAMAKLLDSGSVTLPWNADMDERLDSSLRFLVRTALLEG